MCVNSLAKLSRPGSSISQFPPSPWTMCLFTSLSASAPCNCWSLWKKIHCHFPKNCCYKFDNSAQRWKHWNDAIFLFNFCNEPRTDLKIWQKNKNQALFIFQTNWTTKFHQRNVSGKEHFLTIFLRIYCQFQWRMLKAPPLIPWTYTYRRPDRGQLICSKICSKKL